MEESNRRDNIPWHLVMTNGLRLLPFSKYLIQNKSSISWAFMSLFPQGNLAHLQRHQGLSHISTKLLLTKTEMATNLTIQLQLWFLMFHRLLKNESLKTGWGRMYKICIFLIESGSSRDNMRSSAHPSSFGPSSLRNYGRTINFYQRALLSTLLPLQTHAHSCPESSLKSSHSEAAWAKMIILLVETATL